MTRAQRIAVTLGLVGWLGLVLAVTLRAAPTQAHRIGETPWSCLVCGEAGLTDVLLNLLLFLPFGPLARARGWRLLPFGLAALLLTLGIEGLQETLHAGRDASLGDVVANTLGAVAGWWVAPWLARLASPPPPLARRAAAGALVLGIVVWWLSALAVTPRFSDALPFTGQHLRVWGGHDPFPGTLERASINGVEIPNDPLAVRPADTMTTLVLEVTRADPRTPTRPVTIVRVVDAARRTQLAVGQRGEDLLVQLRTRGSGWRLRTPVWRFPEAMTIPAGVPWRFTWTVERDRLALASGPVGAPPLRTTFAPRSIGLGWAFLHPFGPPVEADAPWWTALWLGGWFALLGWFAGAAGRRTAITCFALGAGAFLLVAWLSGLPVRKDELLAALVAFLAAAVAAAERRRPGRQAAGASGPR